MGFAEEEVANLSDRLVDAVAAWGDLDTVAGRVTEYLEAGADQVALTVLPTGGTAPVSTAKWRQLAETLIPGPTTQAEELPLRSRPPGPGVVVMA